MLLHWYINITQELTLFQLIKAMQSKFMVSQVCPYAFPIPSTKFANSVDHQICINLDCGCEAAVYIA